MIHDQVPYPAARPATMGCCSSKTADETDNDGRKSNPNAPANLKLSSPVTTKPPESIPGRGMPLHLQTSNSHSIGSGSATSPTGVRYSTDPGSAPPPTANNEQKAYVARYAYQARTKEDLSFEKGERLLVVGVQESDWWMAKSLKSQREGYIPRNYVAEALSYEAEE